MRVFFSIPGFRFALEIPMKPKITHPAESLLSANLISLFIKRNIFLQIRVFFKSPASALHWNFPIKAKIPHPAESLLSANLISLFKKQIFCRRFSIPGFRFALEIPNGTKIENGRGMGPGEGGFDQKAEGGPEGPLGLPGRDQDNRILGGV